MIRIFNRLEEGLIALLLAAMTLLTFVQVVLRYVFASGFTWALEAVTYMFGWLVLMGISYGVKTQSHIGVDALVKNLPRTGRKIAGMLGAIVCLAYTTLMLYASWQYVDRVKMIGVLSEDIPVQRWILLLALPIGFLLLLIRFAQVTWRIASGQQDDLGLLDETAHSKKFLEQTEPDHEPGRN